MQQVAIKMQSGMHEGRSPETRKAYGYRRIATCCAGLSGITTTTRDPNQVLDPVYLVLISTISSDGPQDSFFDNHYMTSVASDSVTAV